ncbi:hypothetical protein AOR_1_2064 [Paecilomyces variotii No. 5]|uniref:MARVEL domain-containing protein n=1 Tax=Byssochlamys spectabilis (strain No. 5 / NBRC 109023) TaxID=1356009 RepID=V5I3J8_BYSSN|nr:hypothetical protein AOR_1_2064 [Paecilomyces variotii No. 5]
MRLSASGLRILSMLAHVFQCFSAIIVLGITAWAVESSQTVTVVYALVIAVLTVVIFLGVLLGSIWRPRSPVPFIIIAVVDTILAFLWLTAFVLLANDFSRVGCRRWRWHGHIACGREHTSEAFAFIAFFFTLLAGIFDVLAVYARVRDSRREGVHEEKPRLGTANSDTAAGVRAADGVRAENGVRADGVRADGARADGARADGVRADGVRAGEVSAENAENTRV